MKSNQRRSLLQFAAALAVGGAAAAAAPLTASAQPRSPFTVTPTVIPIAGGSDVFPVRGDIMEGHIDGLPDIRVKVV